MDLNLRKTRTKAGSRLSRTLFLQPLLILFLAFAGLYGGFNWLAQGFIEDQIEETADARYASLDALYEKKAGQTPASPSHFLPSSYMLVGQDGQIHYLSAGEEGEELLKQGPGLVQELDRGFSQVGLGSLEEDDDDLPGYRLTLDDDLYYVTRKSYQGSLEGSYIVAGPGQTYQAYVFIKLSSLQELMLGLNGLLGGLLCLSFVLAILSIFWTSRRLSLSFERLKAYIFQVGNGQTELAPPPLPYQEFKEVGRSIQQMSDMIQANQRSQQAFFQNASHELRTPLMSIQGYVEGIEAGAFQDQSDALKIIHQESLKMAGLVDDLLNLSRLEMGTSQLNVEPLALTDLLYQLTWSLKVQAEDRGLIFKHYFPETIPDIWGDEILLERAFSNLLSNALRYADREICLTLANESDFLVIDIANDGREISPDELPHIFERFYKGHEGNFGLGLAITKEIIERHQGQIRVESGQGRTSFRIYLPKK